MDSPIIRLREQSANTVALSSLPDEVSLLQVFAQLASIILGGFVGQAKELKKLFGGFVGPPPT